MTINAMTDRLRSAAEYLETYGWVQGEMGSQGQSACLTGAIRFCAPQTGDEHLIRQVLAKRDRAESWNDRDSTTDIDVVSFLRNAEITDQDLADTFGPQWVEIVALVRAIPGLSVEQRQKLAYAAYAAAAAAAARWATARAARVLSVRHLIGTRGFTQAHYDTLTGPWRKVVGKLHPEDAEMTA